MEENKKRKKLIVALVSLCSVLAVTVVTMGIVWAATLQTVTSNIRVVYIAEDISGSVAANYYFNSDTATAMTDGNSHSTLTFNGTDANITGTLSPAGNITLGNADGQRFVIFEYIITNASTNSMSAVLTYADSSTSPNLTDANIKVYAYNAGSTQVSTPKTDVATLYGANQANLLSNTTGNLISATIAANSTNYCYIVVAIDNVANDAEFSGVFTWDMTKATGGA